MKFEKINQSRTWYLGGGDLVLPYIVIYPAIFDRVTPLGFRKIPIILFAEVFKGEGHKCFTNTLDYQDLNFF